MGLESATFLSSLVATNPIGATDPKSQGDDHLRLIKSVLLATFPNLNAAMNATPAQLNLLVGFTFLSQPQFAYKAADTDRSNTVTPTDDPDLTMTLQPGTYEVDLQLFWKNITTKTQGMGGGFRFGGTATLFTGHWEGTSDGGGTAEGFADTGGGNTLLNLLPFVLPTTVNVNQVMKARAMIVVTVAGTLAFQWSQFSSSANATRLSKSSFLRVQRMI